MAIQLFVQQHVQSMDQENIKVPHYWAFVRGIHWSPVDSPHKGPVKQAVFPSAPSQCREMIYSAIIFSHFLQ